MNKHWRLVDVSLVLDYTGIITKIKIWPQEGHTWEDVDINNGTEKHQLPDISDFPFCTGNFYGFRPWVSHWCLIRANHFIACFHPSHYSTEVEAYIIFLKLIVKL